MFEKILVAIDGSPESEKALEMAVDLAAHYNAELIAISVVEFTEVPGTVSEVDVGASDTWHGQNLATAIVLRARELGIAGATVVRGVEGFGATSRIYTARILRLSEDLPLKVEIVDRAERIDKLLPLLDEMVTEGLVTVQDVHVARYVHDPQVKPSES